jgi:iron-sulfur cluster assembly accessory protein
MTTITEKVDPITITPQAAENVRQLLADKEMSDHYLRIYVAGIGCSGPQYGLALDQEQRESDTLVEMEDVRILVDANSLSFLEGATIDYAETPQGSGFKIDNPNPFAASACGTCGGGCG